MMVPVLLEISTVSGLARVAYIDTHANNYDYICPLPTLLELIELASKMCAEEQWYINDIG
jgi:hypothetical protein